MSNETEAKKTLVTFRHVVPGSVVQEQTSESVCVSHQFLGGTLSFFQEDHPQLFKDLVNLAKTGGTGVSRVQEDGSSVANIAPEVKAAAEQVKDVAAASASKLAGQAARS